MDSESVPLDNILRKVRSLIAKAEHESTPPEEAKAAQERADEMMRKYKLEEAELDKSRPAEARSMPEFIHVELADGELVGWMARLAELVAVHCDCKIRTYSRYTVNGWTSKVYGFKSDLRYYEILYTTLRLHMLGALRPGLNPALTVAENAYILHNAGLNWFDMAKLEGWYQVPPLPGEPKVMYVNRRTGERQQWSRCIGKYKQGYAQEIARRGEKWMTISPAGTRTFRENACHGYISRIDQRLRAIREKRSQIGNALAIRTDELNEFFKEDNPDLFKPIEVPKGRQRRAKIRYTPYNETAYQSGVRQANTAALDPSATKGSTKEIPNR